MLGVVRAHLDEIAVVAGNVVDLEHLGELGQRLSDPILGAGLVAANGHEGEQSEAQGLGIDLGGVAAEGAPGFELADPLEHRRRGESDDPGNLYLRLAGVGLEEVEDLEVGVVERSVVLHNTAIMAEL